MDKTFADATFLRRAHELLETLEKEPQMSIMFKERTHNIYSPLSYEDTMFEDVLIKAHVVKAAANELIDMFNRYLDLIPGNAVREEKYKEIQERVKTQSICSIANDIKKKTEIAHDLSNSPHFTSLV